MSLYYGLISLSLLKRLWFIAPSLPFSKYENEILAFPSNKQHFLSETTYDWVILIFGNFLLDLGDPIDSIKVFFDP